MHNKQLERQKIENINITFKLVLQCMIDNLKNIRCENNNMKASTILSLRLSREQQVTRLNNLHFFKASLTWDIISM